MLDYFGYHYLNRADASAEVSRATSKIHLAIYLFTPSSLPHCAHVRANNLHAPQIGRTAYRVVVYYAGPT